jgi:phosphomannomutase
MLRHLGCDGGVIITASHNPTPYNGIKLLMENGIVRHPKTPLKSFRSIGTVFFLFAMR